MAVMIRMTRLGRKKIPFYRIIVTEKQNSRDGRIIEQLGTMNPLTDPATVTIQEDRVKYWVGVGAKPSDTVAQLLDKQMPGYLDEIDAKRLAKIRSKRAARKKRAAGGAKKAAKKK